MLPNKLNLLIDGKWTEGRSGHKEPVINPATEEVIGEVPFASAADLDEALAASQKGFRTWSATPAFNRQAVMERAASLMAERRDTMARILTMEMGKSLAESLGEIDFVIGVTRWYGEEGKRAYGRIIPARVPGVRQLVTKEPVGPACAFVAWNFPGTNVIRKIAGALGAGCSIIIKPSEETPATAIAIAECFQDAGLPDGVLNMVFGRPAEVSEHILGSPIPRKLSFTGSVPVGIHLAKLAADTLKRCTMELGGHAPVVVFNDADLDKALDQVVGFKYRNSGQVCISPTRFIVQEDVYDRFADGFTERAKAIKVGSGLDEGVQMGPLVASRRIEVMDQFVADARSKGATVMTGGERIGNRGYFYAPTVLKDVPLDASIMTDEPFGPVAPIVSFKKMDDALQIANSVSVGLASYVFTSNGQTANMMSSELNAGMVGINHPMVSMPETPFGGIDESGYGSEGGIEGLEAYQRTKFITEKDV